MLERRRHKDEDARSVQPLMIQHSQCSGPVAVAPLHPQLQPALRLYDWLGTSGAHLYPGESNGLVLFVPTLMAPTCGVYVNRVRFFFVVVVVYLSKCLAPGRGGEGWQSDMEMQSALWRLSRRSSAWLWVMYGNHAGGLELGKVEAEFVLHPGEGGCGQAVASHVVRVDGRKL